MVRQASEDASEQKVIDDIATHGWHGVHISADEVGPGYAFTIGACHSFGQPEFLIMGLPRAMAHQILDVALDAARSGAITDFTATTDALLEGHQCAFVRVPVEQYRNYVGYARWYYQGDDFMLYQIVWPSRDGHFPWDAEASAQYVESQPLLGPAPPAA